MTYRTFKYTYFPNPKALKRRERETTFPQLCNMLEKLAPCDKKAAPLIKMATFSGQPNDKGCLRYDSAVTTVTGIEGDYDAELVTPEEACERLERHDLLAVIVTTHSHASDRPRWRVLAPLTRDHAPADRIQLVAGLNGALGGILAGESFTLSQSFFIGRPPNGEYKVLRTSGTVCLDEWPDLTTRAVYKNGSSPAAVCDRHAPGEDDEERELLAMLPPKPCPPEELLAELLQGEDVHGNAMRLVGHLVALGTDDKMIRLLFSAVAPAVTEQRGEERARALQGPELQRMIAGARSKGYGAPAASPAAFSFVQACDMQVKPLAWLVRDYIEEDTLAVMYGSPGMGKSFLALDISCCIATGIPFHGHDVKQGGVFYIAGEGHNGIARRLKAWTQHHGIPDMPAELFVSEAPTDLVNDVNVWRVAEAIRQRVNATGVVPRLIVIDTMARNFFGDENSAADVGRFVSNVDSIRRPWGATVLIVHHSGKDNSKGARGSSALKGAVDAEYEVSRPGGGKQIELTAHKMKDAESPPKLSFEMIIVPLLDDTEEVTHSAVLRRTDWAEPAPPVTAPLGGHNKTALAILEQMQGNNSGPILLDEWRARFIQPGTHRQRFPEVKNALLARNLIRIDGENVSLVCPSVQLSLDKPDRTDLETTKPDGSNGKWSQAGQTQSGDGDLDDLI